MKREKQLLQIGEDKTSLQLEPWRIVPEQSWKRCNDWCGVFQEIEIGLFSLV